jgi:6-phosphofructokinase
VLQRAHLGRAVENGIALVKLRGRHAGFVTTEISVASQQMNFRLIPELPFQSETERSATLQDASYIVGSSPGQCSRLDSSRSVRAACAHAATAGKPS